MATPVGHSLIGAAFWRTGRAAAPGPRWAILALAVVAANAPDLDLIPGLFVGDINRYHHAASHSLLAALIFALLAAVALGGRVADVKRVALVFGLLYSSHLLLDFFTADARPPHGIPLLWPFSTEHFISSWTPLRGVQHGDPGAPLSVFFREVFSLHNFRILAAEVLLLSPVLLASWYYPHVRASSRYGKDGRQEILRSPHDAEQR